MPLFFFFLLCSSPIPGARVQLGSQTAQYRVSFPGKADVLPPYGNNGYRQKMVRKGNDLRLEVVVSNRQLSSKAPAKAVSLPPELAELEKVLDSRRNGFLADQVMALFHWLRAEIRYEAIATEKQELADVMTSREANCVGLANLALYVLAEMKVPARYVTGLALKPNDAAKIILEGDVLHRWIEIYYEDVGWVFADPAGKVNFVEATYVVLGVENVHPLDELLHEAVGGKIELLSFRNGLKTVTTFPEVDSRIRVRPNRLYAR